MEAQLRELMPFLRDKNPQVRQVALENLVPQTIKDAPHRNIFFSASGSSGLNKTKESDVIRDLKILCRDQLSVAHDAFKAIVNLSDSPMLVSALSDDSFINFLVSYIINPQSTLADLAAMVLSNLTASSKACSSLITMTVNIIVDPAVPNGYFATNSRSGSCGAPVPYPTGETRDVLALPLLVDAFVEGAQIVESGDLSKRTRKAELHFLASVFANLAISPAGRDFFFTPRAPALTKDTSTAEYLLAKLVSFTEHSNTIRRGGVSSVLKNCAFHNPGHKALLNPESIRIAVPPSNIEAPGIDALPYILLPLAGPDDFDVEDQDKLPEALQFLPPTKKREPDEALRLMHIETLLLLCHTRWGRDYLREHGVYEIVRAAHENETVDKISEHIERLVTLLKGEEPSYNLDDAPYVPPPALRPEEEGETGSELVEVPAVKGLLEDDEDDEDDKIQEV